MRPRRYDPAYEHFVQEDDEEGGGGKKKKKKKEAGEEDFCDVNKPPPKKPAEKRKEAADKDKEADKNGGLFTLEGEFLAALKRAGLAAAREREMRVGGGGRAGGAERGGTKLHRVAKRNAKKNRNVAAACDQSSDGGNVRAQEKIVDGAIARSFRPLARWRTLPLSVRLLARGCWRERSEREKELELPNAARFARTSSHTSSPTH